MSGNRLMASSLVRAARPAASPRPGRPDHDDDAPAGRRALARSLRVLETPSGPALGGGEAEMVAALLLRKLAQESPGADRRAADTLDVRKAFLRHRFTGPVAAFERGDRFYSHLDTFLNLVSIAAGIGASLLVASGSPNGWTIGLGVVIAGCQTLSQWLKPAQRAASRGRAASRLRSEAWDLLQGRDRYRDKDINPAWDVFCSRVDRIEGREQTEEDAETSNPAASTFGNGSSEPGAPRPS